MKHIFVTGGTGFVGHVLIPLLLLRGWNVKIGVRNEEGLGRLPKGASGVVTGDLCFITDWKPLLDGVDAVVHLAARVHQMNEDQRNSQDAYRRMNVKVTQDLAIAASKAGVRRFVFISSVKAMGESTSPGERWDEASPCFPQDAYGRSKWEAEQLLMNVRHKMGLEVVVLRPPLVYGPRMKGNMPRLLGWVDRGWPLPFGGVGNLRSLLYVGNLVNVICVTLNHPDTLSETFLVSDGEDVSTTELIRRIASALGRPARLFSVPPPLLRLAGKFTGKSAEMDRLLGSLVVDNSKIGRILNWDPPYSFDKCLKETVNEYLINLTSNRVQNRMNSVGRP